MEQDTTKMKFQSTKVIDGFSTCFRQEKSHPSHCSVLHGYALSFEVTFEGTLDYRNWVVDFGFMKRSKTRIDERTVDEWFKYMFDHSVLVDVDDSQLNFFLEAEKRKMMRVILMPGGVGCERFAEYVFRKLDIFIREETDERVRVVSVKCIENQKNSAIVWR